MAGPTHSLPTDTRISTELRWQLFFSHLLVAGLTWLFFLPFQPATTNSPYTLLGLEVVFGAGIIGLLLTTNIWLGVRKLEGLLLQLAKGDVTEPLHRFFAGRLSWPFKTLLTNLDVILGKITDTTFRFDQLHQARDQWLAQVGEAVAQSERVRLARELHDTLKQQLFAIGANTTSAQLRWESDPASAKVDLTTVRQLVVQAQSEMKALLQQLQPSLLDSVGLYDALRDQGEALGYRTGAKVKLEAFQMPSADRLPAQTERTIFRVAGEALNNIARHARASEVTIKLQIHQHDGKEWLTLTVADDGQGFDITKPNDSGMGLRGITDRAKQIGAFISVNSTVGIGTVLELWIPLIEPAPDALTAALIELEAKAEKLHARLLRTTVWSSLVAGVSFFIFLYNFPLNSELTKVNPLAVLQTHLIWPSLTLGLLTINYLYLAYSVHHLLGWRFPTTPKAIELAIFKNIVDIVLSLLGFVTLPAIPFWLIPLAVNDISVGISLCMLVFFFGFVLLSFIQRVRISQLRYRLMTPAQQTERAKESRNILIRGCFYFFIAFFVFMQFHFNSEVILYLILSLIHPFPSILFEDWGRDVILSFVAFGILGLLMYYWVHLERVIGRSLSWKLSWLLIAGIIGLGLTTSLIAELGVPKVQLVASFDVATENPANTIIWSPDRTKVGFMQASNSNVMLADLYNHTVHTIRASFGPQNQATLYWSDNSQTLNLLAIGASLEPIRIGYVGGNVSVSQGKPPPLQDWQQDVRNASYFLFSPDRQKFLIHFNSQWYLRSFPDGKLLRTLDLSNMYDAATLTWSPDSRELAFNAQQSNVNEIEVLSVADGQIVTHLKIGPVENRQFPFFNFAWSPDSYQLAVCGYTNSQIQLWNVNSGQLQLTLPDHTCSPFANSNNLFWSPDGRHIAMNGSLAVSVWNVKENSFLGNFYTKAASYNTAINNTIIDSTAIAWSPDGNYLAGSSNQKLLIWKIND